MLKYALIIRKVILNKVHLSDTGLVLVNQRALFINLETQAIDLVTHYQLQRAKLHLGRNKLILMVLGSFLGIDKEIVFRLLVISHQWIMILHNWSLDLTSDSVAICSSMQISLRNTALLVAHLTFIYRKTNSNYSSRSQIGLKALGYLATQG